MRKSIYIIGERCTEELKIGITSDVLRRLKDIQISNPRDIEVLWERSVLHARQVEMAVHRALVGSHIRGEWFNLSLPRAIIVITAIIYRQPTPAPKDIIWDNIKPTDFLFSRPSMILSAVKPKALEDEATPSQPKLRRFPRL